MEIEEFKRSVRDIWSDRFLLLLLFSFNVSKWIIQGTLYLRKDSVTSGLLCHFWTSLSPLGFSVTTESRKTSYDLLLRLQYPFALSCFPHSTPTSHPWRRSRHTSRRRADGDGNLYPYDRGHPVNLPRRVSTQDPGGRPLRPFSLPGRTRTVTSVRRSNIISHTVPS